MPDEVPTLALCMYGPIRLAWRQEQQELDLHGTMLAGTETRPFVLQLDQDAAIQTLRAFRRLLDQVDEEGVAIAKRPNLQ